ncbi:hypothetical protein V6D52_11660 [Idiomarina loihiensis]|uniref:hypothetical protein n=1 Tax=Idiomarina TaxID=135575 RepID=UPI00105B9725|nr:hypothetical protein [Idiomarina]MDV6316238.1 hypothetical protein [Idiomarina sp. HP20-50]
MSQTVSLGAYLSLAKHWLLDVPMNDVHSGSYKYYYYRENTCRHSLHFWISSDSVLDDFD